LKRKHLDAKKKAQQGEEGGAHHVSEELTVFSERSKQDRQLKVSVFLDTNRELARWTMHEEDRRHCEDEKELSCAFHKASHKIVPAATTQHSSSSKERNHDIDNGDKRRETKEDDCGRKPPTFHGLARLTVLAGAAGAPHD
jgi:hypothetical protein